MTLSATDLGASELVQRLRHRLVETETQLRSLRNLGWRPDQLRAMNEEIGRLHAAAERVQPAAAHAVQPLLHSLRDALAAPSMPSSNQTAQMLVLAADALAALPLASDTADQVVRAAMELQPTGLLLNAPRANLLRFMPALTITEGELDEALRLLRLALDA